MEAKIPRGVTCHLERDDNGEWWTVWGADFIGDEPGRKLHPESIFLEEAYKAGRQDVVEWVEANLQYPTRGEGLVLKRNMEWQDKLLEWGIK